MYNHYHLCFMITFLKVQFHKKEKQSWLTGTKEWTEDSWNEDLLKTICLDHFFKSFSSTQAYNGHP